MEKPIIKAALNLLKYRARSCKEVEMRLIKKGFKESEILETISYLNDVGYLNDKEFVRLFIRDKVNQKGVGEIYLKSKLAQHGISNDDINDAIESEFKHISSTDMIKNHISKRKKMLINDDIKKQKQKIIQFLQRKGFTWEQISPHIDSFHSN